MAKRRCTYNLIIPVYSSKLSSYFLRPIGAGIINNNDLPFEIAVQECIKVNIK
jgi:hypothetical protein